MAAERDASADGISADDIVRFLCVKEGRKLRVKIITPGYHPAANCQFPTALRVEGGEYTAPASAVSFAEGSAGTLFYRVSKGAITVATGEDDKTPRQVPDAVVAEKAGKKIADTPLKIYDVDESNTECIVCMAADKEAIYIPCGHFCTCMECAENIKKGAGKGTGTGSGTCPICRAKITKLVNHSALST